MVDVIRNCNLKYECPLKWDSFEETSDVNVRFCTTCKRAIHYCHTPEELRLALLEDHCVAFKVIPDDPEADPYDMAGF